MYWWYNIWKASNGSRSSVIIIAIVCIPSQQILQHEEKLEAKAAKLAGNSTLSCHIDSLK